MGIVLENKVLLNIVRLLQSVYLLQVPVKTGALRKSITVKAIPTKDSVTFTVDYLPYGIYTDKGTGSYYEANPKYNKNPGIGVKGIKPRGWTTLTDATRKNINTLLKEELARTIKSELLKK